jgi:DNA-binding MarR family transcriptional regulator
MNDNTTNGNSYQALLLLEELSKEETISQRDLSRRLGIALGLVNSYVKNMVSKGHIRVTSFPKNRYKYLLTPKGIAEKSRLTYQHLHYFTNLYTTARKDFRELFHKLEKNGVKKIVFCGVDEVAEIAYLSLQETDIELGGVIDPEMANATFFSYTVASIEDMASFDFDRIVVTSLKRRKTLLERLENSGIAVNLICSIKGNE